MPHTPGEAQSYQRIVAEPVPAGPRQTYEFHNGGRQPGGYRDIGPAVPRGIEQHSSPYATNTDPYGSPFPQPPPGLSVEDSNRGSPPEHPRPAFIESPGESNINFTQAAYNGYQEDGAPQWDATAPIPAYQYMAPPGPAAPFENQRGYREGSYGY